MAEIGRNNEKGECTKEIFDVYDLNRNVTGRIHRRGKPMNEGDYHLVVHVCIFNSKNQLLIQRRQPFKHGWPGMWDLTVGGSAVAGEDSRMAAERETREEVGLDISLKDFRPHFTINTDVGFDDYYLIERDIDISDCKLQYDEVEQVRWVDKEELFSMIEQGIMIPYSHYFLEQLFDRKNHQRGSRIITTKNIEVCYAGMQNLESWMNLAECVRWDFPGLETEEKLKEYRNTVVKNINRGSAICAVDYKMVVGILLFSKKRNMLGCLAVHPGYRRRNIATDMIRLMMESMDRTKDITVETFREEDEKGEAPRALYKKLGFIPGELCMAMDYPNQRFIYPADKRI